MMSPIFGPVCFAFAVGAAIAAFGLWLAGRILPPDDEDRRAAFVIGLTTACTLFVFFMGLALVED